MINGYSKQLAWEDSLATLIKGKNSGTLFRSNSLVAYNAALSGQGSDPGWWLCLSMLEDLGSRADVVTCGTVMMCLCRASLSTLALHLLDEADRKHWSNERIYSAAAAACEGESLWKESLVVLRRACRLRLADVVVYGSVGKTCESSSCWEQSLALLPDARSHDTALSTPFANVVLSSCAKAAVWLHAIQVLSCFGRWRLYADDTSRNSCVSGAWPKSLQILATYGADVFGMNAAITVLGNEGLWRRATQLLGNAWLWHLEMDLVSCNSALEAGAKMGQWLASMAILRGALDEHLKVDYLSASSCITACSLALQWPAALQYLPELERIEESAATTEGPALHSLLLAAELEDASFPAAALLTRLRKSAKEVLASGAF